MSRPPLVRVAVDATPSPLLLGAIVLLLGLAGVLVYALVPQATVVLHPMAEPVTGQVEVRADPSIVAVDVATARVPARVSYVVVDVVEQAITRGRLPSAEAKALGSVTFANRHGQAITVPADTIVMTPSGVRFRTTSDAAVEQTARAAVEALEPGERGNVARLEIARVVGPLAAQVAVLNEEATVGGGQSSTPMIAEEDVARVRQLAAERARAEALSKLEGEVRGGESLVLQTLAYVQLDEQLDRRVGEQVSSFNYRLKARVSGSLVAPEDVEQVVRQRWRPTLPPGRYLPAAQLQVLAPEVVRVEERAVLLRVPVQSLAVEAIDADAVQERVRWRPADEARREVARTLKLAADPRVELQPRWAARALRVKVVLDLSEPKRDG